MKYVYWYMQHYQIYQDVLIVCLVLLKNGVTVTLEFGGRREEGEKGEGEGGVENTRGLCRWRSSVCLGVERTNLGVRHLHEKQNKSIKQLNTQDYGVKKNNCTNILQISLVLKSKTQPKCISWKKNCVLLITIGHRARSRGMWNCQLICITVDNL